MSQSQLEQLLKPLIKPAVLLTLSPSDSAVSANCESKFGGFPYAEKDDSWAICSGCNNELMFVAQIKHPQEQSLHTFFYCFECFPWGLGDEEAGQWMIRSYPRPDMANYVELKSVYINEYEITPCHCSETTVQTLPDFQVLESLSPQAHTLCGTEDPDEIYDNAVNGCDCVADYATLIGGYPKWIQNQVGKSCKLCDAEMEFVAQLDSEDEADLMWGDCGMVYLFRCPEHKNEFALELQCY